MHPILTYINHGKDRTTKYRVHGKHFRWYTVTQNTAQTQLLYDDVRERMRYASSNPSTSEQTFPTFFTGIQVQEMHHKCNYYTIMCKRRWGEQAVPSELARSSINEIGAFYHTLILICTIFTDFSWCLMKFLDKSQTRYQFIKFQDFS